MELLTYYSSLYYTSIPCDCGRSNISLHKLYCSKEQNFVTKDMFSFHMVNFPFSYSNILAGPVYILIYKFNYIFSGR
jgi:hypothetical protein